MKQLLSVKKIIAIALTATFIYLAIDKAISAEQFMNIFSLVIAFYFGQSTVRQAIQENKNVADTSTGTQAKMLESDTASE